MNHREPTTAPAGVGQAFPCLALLLLPLLAADPAWSRPILPSEIAPPPPVAYLQEIGPVPLRFLEAAPPPDLVTRPPAAAPPPHAAEEASQAARPDVIPFVPASPAPAAPAIAAVVPANVPAAVPTEDSSPQGPAAILPDDLHPHVRPEDFLPYFQLPASHPGDPNVIVPVPRTPSASTPLPVSSATYTQTPK